jgi:hypothetical protein
VPPDALIGQIIQKPYPMNEKELEHSEKTHQGSVTGSSSLQGRVPTPPRPGPRHPPARPRRALLTRAHAHVGTK